MKRAVSIILQLILFLAVSFAGIILAGVSVLPTLSISIGPGRAFVYDGLLLMLGVYGLILLIEAALKRIQTAWLNSTVAVILALILGLAMKFGFKTV